MEPYYVSSIFYESRIKALWGYYEQNINPMVPYFNSSLVDRFMNIIKFRIAVVILPLCAAENSTNLLPMIIRNKILKIKKEQKT